ncbi:hypothetical protein EV182_008715, partial [Spiromyces aspiralis]
MPAIGYLKSQYDNKQADDSGNNSNHSKNETQQGQQATHNCGPNDTVTRSSSAPPAMAETHRESDIPQSWRDIVRVGPSSIPNAGNGLFAVRDLPAHCPLGFYFGVPMTEDEFDSLKENLGLCSHYSIMYRRTVLDACDENGQPFTDPNGR